MSAAEMLLRYKQAHERLMHPKNPIKDNGINLHPNRIPPKKVFLYLKPSVSTEISIVPYLSVKVAVREIVRKDLRARMNISPICRIVSDIYHLRIKDLKGHSREQRFVIPRHVAFYLIRKHTNMSYGAIGQVFFRDHSTIIHGVENIICKAAQDEVLNRTIKFIEGALHLEAKDAADVSRETSLATDSESHLAPQPIGLISQSEIHGVDQGSGLVHQSS